MGKYCFGVDVGGTFTDVVGINEDGKVYYKNPAKEKNNL